MEQITNSKAPKAGRHVPTLWRISRSLLIVVLLLGLGSLNILSLVNDKVHAVGFNLLKAALAPVLADATISQLLSQSPIQKYSALEKSHKSIEAQHVELKKLSAVRSQVVKKISTKIGRRAVTNAVKNVSSFAAEAVPVVGVAAIVALTVSDIYDDCQILRDLNELNVNFEHEKEDETTVCGMKIP